MSEAKVLGNLPAGRWSDGLTPRKQMRLAKVKAVASHPASRRPDSTGHSRSRALGGRAQNKTTK